jgi:hypothetical protein
MAKPLRVISINFPFKNQSVVQEPQLDTAKTLFDFDVVVVRPANLEMFLSQPPSRVGGEFWIEDRDYHHLKASVTRKSEDLKRLLQQGGVLVVILDAVGYYRFNNSARSYSSTGTIYSVSNYDFIDDRFFLSVRNGSGSSLQLPDPQEPFAKVLKSSTVQWTAFISTRRGYPLSNLRIFAQNGTQAFVGAIAQMGAGHIVLLPNFKALDEEAFLEACREYRFKGEATPPPNWVRSIHLPGENQIIEEMASIEAEIQALIDKHSSVFASRNALLDYKKLLFERGKTHLEPIVRKALDDLGFRTTPSEMIKNSLFEIDGRTNVGSIPGILEVKGSQNQLRFDEFSPFVPKLLEDFRQTGIKARGIFVGNGLCTRPPQEREGPAVFSSQVLQAASTESVALVNSVELYAVVCKALARGITDLELIREAILTTAGYVDLRIFYGKFPST